MVQLYGAIRDEVCEQLTLDADELSYVSKALYVMSGKAESAKHMLEGYGFSEEAAELLYDTARPEHTDGPERVFERLEPFTDADDVEYSDPALSDVQNYL